jgi:hypothetical protein
MRRNVRRSSAKYENGRARTCLAVTFIVSSTRSESIPHGSEPHVIVARILLLLVVLGIAVFVVGLVVGRRLAWIGLALFVGFVGFVVLWSCGPVVLWSCGRWRCGPCCTKSPRSGGRKGTVTFRTVEPGEHTQYGWRVDCEVELNPTGRITWVHTEKEIWGEDKQA